MSEALKHNVSSTDNAPPCIGDIEARFESTGVLHGASRQGPPGVDCEPRVSSLCMNATVSTNPFTTPLLLSVQVHRFHSTDRHERAVSV